MDVSIFESYIKYTDIPDDSLELKDCYYSEHHSINQILKEFSYVATLAIEVIKDKIKAGEISEYEGKCKLFKIKRMIKDSTDWCLEESEVYE